MAKLDHFDDKESRRLFRQLVSAVDYMHLNGLFILTSIFNP